MTAYECSQASTKSDTDVSPESSEYGPVLLPKDQAESTAESTSELSNDETTGLGVRNVGDRIKFDDAAATGTVGLDLSITEIVSTRSELIGVDSTTQIAVGSYPLSRVPPMKVRFLAVIRSNRNKSPMR